MSNEKKRYSGYQGDCKKRSDNNLKNSQKMFLPEDKDHIGVRPPYDFLKEKGSEIKEEAVALSNIFCESMKLFL